VRGAKDHDAALPAGGAALSFGIGPMDRKTVDATHRIVITHGNDAADDRFEYVPSTKSLPFAMWGGVLRPNLHQPQLVASLLTGYEIRPKAPRQPSDQPTIDRSALQNPTPLFTEHDAFGWKAPAPFVPAAGGDVERRNTIDQTIGAQEVGDRRTAIAATLLPDATLDLGGFDADEFLAVPLVSR
jgi:hypothetical protein